jgi:hypothetical protein
MCCFTVKSNIEENISEKGASSAEKEVNCSSEKGDNSSFSERGVNSSRSEEPAVNMSQSVDDIWKKLPPERSPSSKSDSGVIKSISFIDEKNARDFLAKQFRSCQSFAAAVHTPTGQGYLILTVRLTKYLSLCF